MTHLAQGILDRLRDCNCPSGLKAIYYCNFGDKCRFSAQAEYCEACQHVERHYHFSGRIVDAVLFLSNQWIEVKRLISDMLKIVNMKFKDFGELIRFLQ